MKKIIASFALVCISLTGFCQAGSESPTSYYFKKELPVEPLAGKNFRFEIAVHSNNASPLHAMRAQSEIRNASGELQSNALNIEWRREQDWEIATISGRVDEAVRAFSIQTLLNSGGEFYFDDINLYVEESPGRWRQISVSNASFEQVDGFMIPGYSFSYNNGKSISRQVAKVGRQSLRICLGKSLVSNNISVSN